MFAPPFPAGPSSPSPTPSPYQHLGAGPARSHPRQRSQSWDRSAGLPPRPFEIDDVARDARRGLLPSDSWQTNVRHEDAARSRPTSPLDYAQEPSAAIAVSKHPKVKVDIVLNSPLFEAGGAVTGRLELTSATSQKLRLGEIAVELEGFEELTSRDHSATQTFLYNRTLFQGHHLPPSNAVHPTAPVHGHWTARKGRTTFPFSFRLPAVLPSSVVFAGNAAVRYVVKGSVQAWYQESRSIVSSKVDATVVERWDDEGEEVYREPVDGAAETKLLLGGNGSVWLDAGLQQRLFVAGGKAFINMRVRNASKRDHSGVRVDVVRSLSLPQTSDAPHIQARGPTITEVIHTQHYRGQPFEFAANCDLALNIPIDIPRDTRSVRKTRLFEVAVGVVVTLPLGAFAKDAEVRLPIFVAHPGSLQAAWDGTMAGVHSSPHDAYTPAYRHSPIAGDQNVNRYPSPSPGPAQHPHIPRSQSAMSHHGSHDPYPGAHRELLHSPTLAMQGGMISLPQTPLPHLIPQVHHGQQAQLPLGFAANVPNVGHADAGAPPSPSVQHVRTDIAAPTWYNNALSARAIESNSPASPSFANAAGALQSVSQPVSPHMPSTTVSPGSAPYDQPSEELQAVIEPHDGLRGLATIIEDSESAANTMRSVRPLGGDRTGAKRSVSPAEVELFESMAGDKESGEPQGVGKPESAHLTVEKHTSARPRASEIFVDPKESASLNNAPSAGEPPIDANDELHTESQGVWPANVDKFDDHANRKVPAHLATPDTKAANLSLPAAGVGANVAPVRPKSAQGQGLGGLEELLGGKMVLTPDPSEQPDKKPSNRDVAAASHTAEHSRKASGLRAAALKRAQQKQDLVSVPLASSIGTGATQHPEAIVSSVEMRDLPTQSSSISPVVQAPCKTASEDAVKNTTIPHSVASGPGRDNEARQLGKAAVGRIGGWLSDTQRNDEDVGRRSRADLSVSGSSTSVHTENTPKTPSASAILPIRMRVKPAASAQSADASLSSSSDVVSDNSSSSLARLPRSSSGLEALKRYQRATEGKQKMARVQSNAEDPIERATVRPHASQESQRGAVRPTVSGNDQNLAASSVISNKAGVVAPRPVSLSSRSVADSGPKQPPGSSTGDGMPLPVKALASTFEVSPDVARSGAEQPNDKSTAYDVRSARGGKGGRVASAASLWASIANGTDGKLPASGSSLTVNPSMRRTTVNARPQARRSMNGEAPPLDFTNREQVESAIAAQEGERKAIEAPSPAVRRLPAQASPKAIRPQANNNKTRATIAIPSAFCGHPQYSKKPSDEVTAGRLSEENKSPTEGGQLPKITRRGAAPFLNTTTPKVHLSSKTTEPAAGMASDGVSDTTMDPSAFAKRGTTRAVGKERLNELRSLFAA